MRVPRPHFGKVDARDSRRLHEVIHSHQLDRSEHTRVYLWIKQTPKAQFWRTLSAQMSVYGALFLKNFPPVGIHILHPVELKFTLSENDPNSPSRRGAFSQEKVRHRQTFEH